MANELKELCRRCKSDIIVTVEAFNSGASFKHSVPYRYGADGESQGLFIVKLCPACHEALRTAGQLDSFAEMELALTTAPRMG